MIRPGTLSDIPQLLTIASSSPVFTAAELSCLDEDLHGVLKDKNGDFILVEDEEDGDITGFIHYGPLVITERAWCIWWIAVDKVRQGEGIGKKLIKAMEKEIEKSQGRIIFVETSSRDIYNPTRMFYLNNLYLLNTTIEKYYSDTDDKCIFSKIM